MLLSLNTKTIAERSARNLLIYQLLVKVSPTFQMTNMPLRGSQSSLNESEKRIPVWY